jgi:RHS repeat-associated protein
VARFAIAFCLFASFVSVAAAQLDPSAGIQPFSTQVGGQYDSINLASSNISLAIPIIQKNGKFPFSYQLVGNFGAFPVQTGTGFYYEISAGIPSLPGGGLTGTPVAADLGSGRFGWPAGGFHPFPADDVGVWVSYTIKDSTCVLPDGDTGYYELDTNFAVVDAMGTTHPLPADFSVKFNEYTNEPGCGAIIDGQSETYDGSGYQIVATLNNPPTGYTTTIYDRSGNAQTTAGIVKDPDEVTASFSKNSTTGVTTYTDTLGQSVLTSSPGNMFSRNGASDVYTYSDLNGNVNVNVNYTQYYQQTNFGCGQGTEFNTPGLAYFPTSVVLADGETYLISYEGTPDNSGDNPPHITGRIARLTLPNGGYIAYGYSGSNNGIICGFGSVPTLTRTINDNNGHIGTWTYVSSITAQGTDTYDTVTETDPAGDITTYQFYDGYQTEKIISDVNLGVLSTEVTCYNGINSSKSTCITPAPNTLPAGTSLFQTDVYTTLGTSSSPSLVETTYDQQNGSVGDVLSVKHYGFGAMYPPSGTPVSETDTTYANVNGVSCGSISSYILDHPCKVTTLSSGSMVSQTSYTYNAGGHPTQTTTYVNGSLNLTSSASYNTNGTISSLTDVNGATTNYYYNGVFGCNDLLLTSTVLPVNTLTTAQTWNCTGGVLTSSIDANTQVTVYGYVDQNGKADPLWRVRSVQDPLDNITWTTYSPGGTLPATVETSLLFNNGASGVDVLTTNDGLGRSYLSQTRQAPGSANFDTVATTYDALGRVSSVGVPCLSTASLPCGSSVTTTTYDALNRPLQVTDGGGGYTSYKSEINDMLVTIGPAPSGENNKQKQLEYDGLGRLTSVCELTSSANGGGSCAQTTPQTGYWTKYTYDGLNRLTGIAQNAQSTPQTRMFQYDGLDRLTSETNPEWGPGTATYTYDSDASGKCPGPYNGDLVKRTDNAGNVSCYAYDCLHRELSTSYTGPNATTNRYFVYDAATVNAQSMANAKARLAEGYTATCSTCTKVTDEGFGYTARGELSNFYESTPNSAGYYSIPITYWANGLIETFGPFLTEDEIGYIPDGEGRAGSIYDFSYGSTPVPSISYNTSTGQPTGNQPTQLETSCSGSTCYPITYQYDPNTLRMTYYGVALNGGTISGSLMWNPNASLQKLVIADPFNAADAQTCTYSADDLSRLASVNCGSAWAQTFSYDAFGNLTKGGSVAWVPGYSASTNRYTLSGASYDSDGNVLNDTFNKYTWDAEGKPLSTAYSEGSGETYTFVYDAFGHKVEYSANGVYQNSYVRIANFKLSATGQTPAYSEYPFPGGSLASEYGGGTGVQLGDWLGTSRAFWSYTGGNFGQSGAHAPFGESYAYSSGYPKDFTGQQSDGSMTNTTYYFPERQYRSSQGRWLSPDPAGAADPSSPQSWNRYAYVMNNPLSNTDPDGLWCYYGATNDDGGIDQNSPDAGNISNYDFHSTQSECEGANGSNGGTWYPDSVDTVTVDGGSPSMVDTITSTLTGVGNQVLNTVQDAGSTATNWLLAPRNPGCMAGATAAGAGTGALVGGGIGSLGFAGGPAGFVTTPVGVGTGAFFGVQAGFAGGMIYCAKGLGPNFGGNQRENRQANDAKRAAERKTGRTMSRSQERLFHDIDKTGMSYSDMVRLAVGIINKVVNMP